jgi:hypothetical protein
VHAAPCTINGMRLLPLFLLVASCIVSAEEGDTYPLWDGRESIEDYSRRAGLSPTMSLSLGNGVFLDFVLIPAGKFMMGSAPPEKPKESPFIGIALCAVFSLFLVLIFLFIAVQSFSQMKRPQFSLRVLFVVCLCMSLAIFGGLRGWSAATEHADYKRKLALFEASDPSEIPVHWVTISKPFYLGKLAVTQEQFMQVMQSNPSANAAAKNPADSVSRQAAEEFCERTGVLCARPIRLPTEAEWEFACRAGTTTVYYSGETMDALKKIAWFAGNSGEIRTPLVFCSQTLSVSMTCPATCGSGARIGTMSDTTNVLPWKIQEALRLES